MEGRSIGLDPTLRRRHQSFSLKTHLHRPFIAGFAMGGSQMSCLPAPVTLIPEPGKDYAMELQKVKISTFKAGCVIAVRQPGLYSWRKNADLHHRCIVRGRHHAGSQPRDTARYTTRRR
ncbi:hypothetical protein C1X21_29900 [Pseudomonas sp. FW305-3-2-15-A-LB2]|nr:hypothetical protein C1X17_29860 [Pseudomonas sp. FW305-3-2-15-C-TSA2]PMV18183.1 hypothetical protein C1X22_29875 [Pseudomonas sp. DP16D-L5]PMV31690.1 hypothetical protein C1X21_29900 [Pseudomonas sp. FW305-3-2-15-A-LB2]PMV37584.1 hypothetical protein C1X16_29940 [Pseudomonas sp. FW305-3-2-15-C-R2A1]PMV46080.1 hypothetical protein C1X19_29830 [Pseudomonas sp. GW460-4]PMV49209.1 hypothetical protein C1X18_18620 [Pseudomonas sp. FW305-3-2-15-C-LB1]PMV54934.1 hypothetical protein C1X20_29890 